MVGRSRTHHMNAVASIRAGCRVRTLSATLKRDYQLRPTWPGPGVGPHAQARGGPPGGTSTDLHAHVLRVHAHVHAQHVHAHVHVHVHVHVARPTGDGRGGTQAEGVTTRAAWLINSLLLSSEVKMYFVSGSLGETQTATDKVPCRTRTQAPSGPRTDTEGRRESERGAGDPAPRRGRRPV